MRNLSKKQMCGYPVSLVKHGGTLVVLVDAGLTQAMAKKIKNWNCHFCFVIPDRLIE